MQVTNAVVLRAFPEYHRIHDEVHVHITHVPIVDKLRDLREVQCTMKIRCGTGLDCRFFGVLRDLQRYILRMRIGRPERERGGEKESHVRACECERERACESEAIPTYTRLSDGFRNSFTGQ